MTVSDPVRLIEAAYTYVPGEKEWLGSLVQASVPWDVGRGVLACTIELGDRPRVRSIWATPEAEAVAQPVRSFVESMPARRAPEMFAPAEFVGNAAWRLKRLSMGLELPPLWALVAGGARNAIVVAFPARSADFDAEHPFPHRDRRTLGLVGAHIGAALRLRAASMPAWAPSDTETEAVLSPDGKIVDANGAGKPATARRSLSEAVVQAERARGKLRRTNGEEATNLWRALVDGRWSIVEVVESDGKRLLLARANPTDARDLTALSKGESDVVWLTAFGHSFKYIGYELGLSTSAVVRRLKSAMLKLGVSTRGELLRKLGR